MTTYIVEYQPSYDVWIVYCMPEHTQVFSTVYRSEACAMAGIREVAA
jgi:hypothetical protein